MIDKFNEIQLIFDENPEMLQY